MPSSLFLGSKPSPKSLTNSIAFAHESVIQHSSARPPYRSVTPHQLRWLECWGWESRTPHSRDWLVTWNHRAGVSQVASLGGLSKWPEHPRNMEGSSGKGLKGDRDRSHNCFGDLSQGHTAWPLSDLSHALPPNREAHHLGGVQGSRRAAELGTPSASFRGSRSRLPLHRLSVSDGPSTRHGPAGGGQ